MKDAISSREEKILKLAYEDTLTQLPNRVLFNDRLEQAIAAADRAGSPLAVLIMDLDRFKHVNETLGHHVGDQVLQQIAGRLRTLLRKSDTVARLGGDEFGILLPDSGVEHAQLIVSKILAALEVPITIQGQPMDMTTSIGIAAYPEHSRDPGAIVRHADMAMYSAKRSNRGYAVYDESFSQPRSEHLTLLGELRQAVEQNELTLYYQPKASLLTGKTEHVEALVRWVHPRRGFISPDQFIPFAEQTGYIRTLTRWIIDNAIRQRRQWRDRGIDLTVSLNISARDLLNPDLPKIITDALRENGVPAGDICLEITESGVMEDPAHAIEILKQLRAMGLGLSVDDYGTGYSSLSYIKRMPIQELKIDQSFVKNMINDEDDATIVKSTIELGHNMGLKVVAEGVEDLQVWNMLRAMKCDLAQGYFMSAPLSATDLEIWLAAGVGFGQLVAV
jgi:diguanylate cyclase (GGDEF)-like protein